MSDFDRPARRAIRDDPEAHLRWWLPKLMEQLVYSGPMESQAAPRPGEPERRCDTIFELGHPEGLGVPWGAVLEAFTRPDGEAVDRLGEYLFRYRRDLRHGPYRQDRFRWAGVLVFLTGSPENTEVSDAAPEGDCELTFKPKVVCLANKDALATLRAIGENRLGAAVLAWVPLMKGGNTQEALALWCEVCLAREPLELRRRELAALAVMLAELTECQPLWQEGLEGFSVTESTLLRREREKGQLLARREDLVRTLRLRFKEAAEDLIPRIQAEIDSARLVQWHDLAVIEDLNKVREAMGG